MSPLSHEFNVNSRFEKRSSETILPQPTGPSATTRKNCAVGKAGRGAVCFAPASKGAFLWSETMFRSGGEYVSPSGAHTAAVKKAS